MRTELEILQKYREIEKTELLARYVYVLINPDEHSYPPR